MKLYIFLFSLLLFSTLVSSYIYEINYSQLPYSKIEEFIISYDENLTNIYSTTTYNTFLSGVTFVNVTNITGLLSQNVTIIVPQYSIINNYSTNLTLILYGYLNSSFKSYQYLIEFNISILNYSILENKTEFIHVSEDKILYDICDTDLNFQDYIRTYQTSVKTSNSSFAVICDSWLYCLSPILPNLETIVYNITITVPKQTSLGLYSKKAVFNLLNFQDNFTIDINVKQCPVKIPSFSEIISNECKNDSDIIGFKNCVEALSKFFGDIGIILNQVNKTQLINVTQNISIPYVVQVYDPDTSLFLKQSIQDYSTLSSLVSDIDSFKTLNSNLQTKIDEVNGKYSILLETIPDRTKAVIDSVMIENKNLTNLILSERKETIKIKTVSFIFLGIFTPIVLLGLIFGGVVLYKKNNFY